jgi:Rod binding domain-containing protein
MIAPIGQSQPPQASAEAKQRAAVGTQFEALIIAQLLKSARAADLGDDLMGQNGISGGGQVRDMIDQARADALARTGPFGLAKLLETKP